MYIHLFIPTEKYLAVFWHMLLLWCCCVIIKAISKIFWSSQYYPPPSTISHPHRAFFPPFFSKLLWIVVNFFLRIFVSTRYLKCTISREAYLPLWVLSTRPFKERIWDSPKNENAPHQMLWKGVSKTLYPNPGHTWYLSFFYTSEFWSLEILHSKVRKFATKIASRQNSVNHRIRSKLHTMCQITHYV